MSRKQNLKSQKIILEDPFLWGSFLLILIFGLAVLYSASLHSAGRIYGDQFYFIKKQVIFAAGGLVCLFFFRFLPYKNLKKAAYPGILLSIILLAAIYLTPLGHTVGGASRWLKLPFISFQPGVFSFYTIIIYLAHTISIHQEDMHSFKKGILPHLILFAIFALFLYFQPDFGSIVITAAIIWIMLISGGARTKHMALLTCTGIALGTFFMLQQDYRVDRILSFLNPWEYSSTISYQATMSLKAFINGGFFGTGLGDGMLKLEYLPESHTDFIFSIIGEETGFIGVFFLVFLFSAFLIRGFKIAENAPDKFGALLAAGITSVIGLHVVINMGVTLSILPPKGLPLPFISYGGTALLMNMSAVGILMNIGAASDG